MKQQIKKYINLFFLLHTNLFDSMSTVLIMLQDNLQLLVPCVSGVSSENVSNEKFTYCNGSHLFNHN